MRFVFPQRLSSDIRVIELIHTHGFEAYGVLIALFERMVIDGDNKLKCPLRIAAFGIRAPLELVERVVAASLSLGLLVLDDDSALISPLLSQENSK